MRRSFLLIANPGAGQSNSALVNQVAAALRQAGATVECLQPPDIGAARRAAHEAAKAGLVDAIVAAGGDGTIRQIAAALLDTDAPLGVIPAGTGNVLAHEIGLAPNTRSITAMLLKGATVRVLAARANDEPFLLMAGAGFDGRVVAALDHRFKSYVGKAAYAGPILGALVRPVDALTVTLDGNRHEASWAVITNARHYGGRFVLAPRAGIQERGLHAVLFKARNRAVLMGQLVSLITGRLDARAASRGDVEVLDCARASIVSHHPVPAQIDGDAFGVTPLHIETGATHVRLIVPSGPAGAGATGR